MPVQLYSSEHEIFRRAFKKFLEQKVVPFIDQWETDKNIPRSVWKEFGDQGYLCTWMDEKYGGSGAEPQYSLIILEELSRLGTGTGIPLHSDIIAPYINTYGSEEQKKKWLPRCATGDIILSIAMTEPNAGSDLAAMRTTAVRDGDHYILNGSKVFITNGINSDLVVVACKTDSTVVPSYRGISLICVEDGTPGYVKGRKLNKLGLRSNDTAELFFDNCRVPISNLLGEENSGFKYLMSNLQPERLISVIGSQVMAERILEDAINYAKGRMAFGQPISKFQHNQFKIVEMATEIELGRTFLNSLIEDNIAGKDIVTKVSMAKYWISELVNKVAYNCLQLYGGYGFMEEYPIARFYRDVRIHNIAGGTTEVMKDVIAKRMGL